MERRQQRLSLLISRSIRSRSPAEVKPRQEGKAYIKDATVVALATSFNCGVGRPWRPRTLRAYQEEQELRAWSKCSLIRHLASVCETWWLLWDVVAHW